MSLPLVSSVVEDGIEWERYPIYAPIGPNVPHQHLVKFLNQLPTVPIKQTDTPLPPSQQPQPKLLYPFSSATRLCTPRHVDYRAKFVNRKKTMKSAVGASSATAGSAAAGGAASAPGAANKKEADDEGVDPTERKWRLEDPKQSRVRRYQSTLNMIHD